MFFFLLTLETETLFLKKASTLNSKLDKKRNNRFGDVKKEKMKTNAIVKSEDFITVEP